MGDLLLWSSEPTAKLKATYQGKHCLIMKEELRRADSFEPRFPWTCFMSQDNKARGLHSNHLPSIGFHEIEFAEKFKMVFASSLDVRRS